MLCYDVAGALHSNPQSSSHRNELHIRLPRHTDFSQDLYNKGRIRVFHPPLRPPSSRVRRELHAHSFLPLQCHLRGNLKRVPSPPQSSLGRTATHRGRSAVSVPIRVAYHSLHHSKVPPLSGSCLPRRSARSSFLQRHVLSPVRHSVRDAHRYARHPSRVEL